MGADSDVMGFAEAYSVHHDERVAGVETTGYIGVRDVGQKLFVGPLRIWLVYLDDLNGRTFLRI